MGGLSFCEVDMPRRKTTRKKVTLKLPPLKEGWETKLYEKMLPLHSRSALAKVKKLMKRLTTLKSSLVTRSRKYGVECTVTLDELCQLAYDAYGTECKYSGRILTVANMVFDHIHPISKGGSSNLDNLQVISKFSNTMKGSLEEHDFLILLSWLDELPEELRKDVSIRLARGIR